MQQTVRTCRADCARRAEYTVAFKWDGKGFWYPTPPNKSDPPYYCLEHAIERSMTLNERGEGVRA